MSHFFFVAYQVTSEMGSALKGKRKQILFFYSRLLFSEWSQTNFERVASLDSVSIPLFLYQVVKKTCSQFRTNTVKRLGIQIFRVNKVIFFLKKKKSVMAAF